MQLVRFRRRFARARRRLGQWLGLDPPRSEDYTKSWSEVQRYVGTDPISGGQQFELLKLAGCRPSSRVLEVGCGALHAGIPLMSYLQPGHYVGIDPNAWIREETLRDEEVRRLVEEKTARFLTRDDFDAAELGLKFDYVLSHSVLSHAAHHQLEQFLTRTRDVLAPGGRILASLRLAEGNPFGNKGSKDGKDTRATEWRYPGGVWFKHSTVRATAAKLGLTAAYAPELTELYTRTRPNESHDWFAFARHAAPVEELRPTPPLTNAERSGRPEPVG